MGIQNKLDSNNLVLKKLGSSNLLLNKFGFKQLGPGVETGVHGVQVEKRVWFEMELQGAQGDREAEVFQVSNDDAVVAQRRLEDKKLEEKTNTDCLVKEQEKLHLGIKVGANIMIIEVPGQEGEEGNVAEKKKVKESMEANLGKLLKYNAWSTRWSPVRGVRHSMIRELIMNEVVSIEFVRSQQNLADHLTKGLARDLVIKSAEEIGSSGLLALTTFMNWIWTHGLDTIVIGSSGGLFCLYALDKAMLVVWNPSIRRSVGIVAPRIFEVFGFVVCPVSNDPTVVKILFPCSSLFVQHQEMECDKV
ncbi:hypothetical protein Tco_0123375 [Tanacetum coccineum]